MKDQFLREHVPALSSRQFDQALHHVVRTWNNAETLFPAPCLKDDHCIDLFIPEERERLALAYDRRRAQGNDIMVKILLQVLFLFRLRSLEIDQLDPVSGNLLHEFLIGFVLPLIEPLNFL